MPLIEQLKHIEKKYGEEWITQRMRTIETRKDLTAEWHRPGVKNPTEYAILTDEISEAWSGMTTRQYKDFKGLKKESLRDNMTNMELILNMLAEGLPQKLAKLKIHRVLKKANPLLMMVVNLLVTIEKNLKIGLEEN